MKTAAHATYTGPGRIVISLGSPRGAPAGYKIFRKLAPTREILNLGHDRSAYEVRFRREILGVLDPRETWQQLHQLANGAEPVLQCFERPPFTACNWCHRRMVADWFLETLGEVVDELTPETREQRDAHAQARLAKQVAPGVSTMLIPLRPAVEAIRAEIDKWWTAVLAPLGITRDWTWMAMPDRIRALLDFGYLAEWDELQERYKWVDASK